MERHGADDWMGKGQMDKYGGSMEELGDCVYEWMSGWMQGQREK